MPKTLVIIDGSSLVHRAFYALPLLSTAGGQYTNAVYGFTTMLVKLLGDIKPDYIAVAFDKSKLTFRNEAYKDYKAHRKATPTELAEQFGTVREVLAAFGINVLELAGFEADDIIGTLSAKAAEQDYNVIIVTGDRDALQLIGPQVKVMLTRKGISETELFDAAALKAKYGVTPAQITDLKGLMGDSSDNIPGISGIGEKTAAKLIAEFGSIENLVQNIDKVSGKKLQEKLKDNVEIALLSKQLATIVRDVPIEIAWEDMKMTPDSERLHQLFTTLEFKSLIPKLPQILGGEVKPPAEEVTELAAARIFTSPDDVQAVIDFVREQRELIFYPLVRGRVPDIELTGLGSVYQGQAVYVPAGAAGWDELLQLLTDPAISKITYNAKNIINACLALSLKAAGLKFDVLLAAYLLEPTTSEYPLVELANKYLGENIKWPEKKVIVTPDYAAWAALTISKLWPVLADKLAADLTRLYNEIELPLVDVLAAMEYTGIHIDENQLTVMAGEFAQRIDKLLANIYQAAGEEFNVNSTKQLGLILFEKLKLPVIKKTKTGYSTDAEVLEKLAGQHPLIDYLLEYRLLTKLKSTYLDGLHLLIHRGTHRIHTSFNQTVTATGRLSSSDPNLQNIPIRTGIGRQIRELFVPGKGYAYIMSADYSQIELRVLAHISGDANLIDAFRHNQDIHTRTAAEVFGVSMENVTSEMRSRAKAVNFGIVYGISDFGLARDIGVSRKEAGQYIDSYFAKYQGVKAYIDEIIASARAYGYVTTMFGRRRYLPDINSSNFNQRSFAERTAMNTPIQGTAADIIKKAMIDVQNKLTAGNFASRVLLQVHDELVLEVTEDEKEAVAALVKQAMEAAADLAVPLIADVKFGKTWAQAK